MKLRRSEVVILVALVLLAVAWLATFLACDGVMVRTTLWFRCLP